MPNSGPVSELIQRCFGKSPTAVKRKDKNAVNINLYQCAISKRLVIPVGDKIKNNVGIPRWIFSKKKYLLKCLKGLFETDGCFQQDDGNYAQYIEFKNNCRRLLKDVYNILRGLGYNPQFGKNYIRLARKQEVYSFKRRIDFRNYIAL